MSPKSALTFGKYLMSYWFVCLISKVNFCEIKRRFAYISEFQFCFLVNFNPIMGQRKAYFSGVFYFVPLRDIRVKNLACKDSPCLFLASFDSIL